ncbi:MAG: DNA cytosine methyltransferase [Terriglobia bacterium]
MNRAYYNDFDPFVCEWLRNLIAAGHIPEGDVDGRSITEVDPGDLAGYTQCHFFAGIAGWSLALRLAGVPDLECWTGSCPCQPFSAAGGRKGTADERHLFPVWFNLIRQCKPDTIFGEQVDSAIGHGWLDIVFGDLEGEGYACGAAVLGAHSVGAPHKRQRLYWVADSQGVGLEGGRGTDIPGCATGGSTQGELAGGPGHSGVLDGELDAPGCPGPGVVRGDEYAQRRGTLGGFWADAEWLPCRDGKYRPIEPGTFPLADGVPSRVGQLRAYGNAIVPQVAAEFVRQWTIANRPGRMSHLEEK